MKRTPLDECGRVYKNLDQVLGVLKRQGIAKVAHRMRPVADIKGTDQINKNFFADDEGITRILHS